MTPLRAPARSAAFFDFDYTLIHGDAGPLFGRALFASRSKARHGWARTKLMLRYLPYISWMGVQAGLYKLKARRRSNLVRSAYKGLRGAPSSDVYTAMEEFVDEQIPRRIYPEIVARIQHHLDEGARVVIITTGMEPLVERCLRHFPKGIEVIGCLLEERDGRLTGHVDGPLFGVDKANILKAYCKSLGIDPGDCWAYSDHWSDKEMLLAVGHPVTVNPRSRLRELAQRNGWEVLEPKLV